MCGSEGIETRVILDNHFSSMSVEINSIFYNTIMTCLEVYLNWHTACCAVIKANFGCEDGIYIGGILTVDCEIRISR